MSTKYGVLLAATILFTATAVSVAPSHPLSQIHPMDTNLGLNGKSLYGVNEFRTNDTVGGHLVIKDNLIKHSSGGMSLTFNPGSAFVFSGVDASLSGNNLLSTGHVQFSDTNSDSNIFTIGERPGGNLAVRNTNTGSNVYEIGPAGEIKAGGNFSTGSMVGFENGIQLGANVDMGRSRVTNMADPVNAQDAVTKKYVDQGDANSTQSLSEVLAVGNYAGSYSINMNGQRVQGLAAANSGDDAMRKDNIQA
ncbi:MAG: hypothetical protein ABEJ99_01645, partial [Candidatus Nanohaloarchaea archaeon]